MSSKHTTWNKSNQCCVVVQGHLGLTSGWMTPKVPIRFFRKKTSACRPGKKVGTVEGRMVKSPVCEAVRRSTPTISITRSTTPWMIWEPHITGSKPAFCKHPLTQASEVVSKCTVLDKDMQAGGSKRCRQAIFALEPCDHPLRRRSPRSVRGAEH